MSVQVATSNTDAIWNHLIYELDPSSRVNKKKPTNGEVNISHETTTSCGFITDIYLTISLFYTQWG